MSMNDALQSPSETGATDFHLWKFDRINNQRKAKIKAYEDAAVNGVVLVNGNPYPIGQVRDQLDLIYNEQLEAAGWQYDANSDTWKRKP